MDHIFNSVCCSTSRITTKRYSTSFSSGILLFNRKIRQDIYNIYGYVRFADEIVDTYSGKDKPEILSDFKKETFSAINRGVSFNPIIHSFQHAVNKHKIDLDLIKSFLRSMEMDLDLKHYDKDGFDDYVYGSAEVIGLMCLSIFVSDRNEFNRLKPFAISLGSAFQKINFLRDLENDFNDRGRSYFPNVEINGFSIDEKKLIEAEIQMELDRARQGIFQLPSNSRFGVLLAFLYYEKLFNKICSSTPSDLRKVRIRIPNWQKAIIFLKMIFRFYLLNRKG